MTENLDQEKNIPVNIDALLERNTEITSEEIAELFKLLKEFINERDLTEEEKQALIMRLFFVIVSHNTRIEKEKMANEK